MAYVVSRAHFNGKNIFEVIHVVTGSHLICPAAVTTYEALCQEIACVRFRVKLFHLTLLHLLHDRMIRSTMNLLLLLSRKPLIV
ncbi:hypothetical protein EXS73_03180 [Candidatus Pacearchaeota archaeon]|nr:hypothetical protein [Candidatus Pacearchaeota archaeon]